MRKVLLDSSVWISLFARDTNYAKAHAIIASILSKNVSIIVPPLVYIEVISGLTRLKIGRAEIAEFKNFLRIDRRIHFCHTTSSFWRNEIAHLAESIPLRSHDMIIVAHAIKYEASLISFDRKMNRVYKLICNY